MTMLKKLGCQQEGIRKQYIYTDGRYMDEISKLEHFYKIAGLDDIKNKTMEAKSECKRLIEELEEIYKLT